MTSRKLLPKIYRMPDQRPAVLRMMLAGHGIVMSQTAIEEQLPVDSTVVGEQMAALAEAADAFGCEIGPRGVSAEFILAAQTPTIVWIRIIPTDDPYPAIVWNKIGILYQVLDPKVGRRFLTRESLLRELYTEQTLWTVEACEAAIKHPSWQHVLQARLEQLQIDREESSETTPLEWAKLHGSLRLVEEMVAGGAQRGAEAEQLLNYFHNSDAPHTIPVDYQPFIASDNETHLLFQGIPALPILQCMEVESVEALPADADQVEAQPAEPKQKKSPGSTGRPQGILPHLFQTLREEGAFHPVIIVVATLIGGASLFLEAVLLRGMMEIGRIFDTPSDRTTVIALLIGFMLLLFSLRWALADQTKKVGRRFDLRLRQAAFAVVPRLSDQYFQKLAPADIVDRVYKLRNIPDLTTNASDLLSTVIRIIMITIGIAAIDWPLAIISFAGFYIGIVAYQYVSPSLYQNAYRVRVIGSWLSVVYVDAVRGRSSIWSHGAEQPMRYEYEQGLVQHAHARLVGQWDAMLLTTLLSFVTIGTPILQLVLYTARGGSAVNLLLLFYWVMELNQLLGQVINQTVQMITYMADANRFGEVLQTPAEETLLPEPTDAQEDAPYIQFEDVHIQLGDQPILREINLAIAKGEHLAVVGTSGAGKSTLVSLLLGRHYASSGSVRVNGAMLDYVRLQELRRNTAWVDPNMQLWDQSLLHNLQYGTQRNARGDLLHRSIEQADLLSVLGRMPDGLASQLGESGKRVSGGEGQRIRFGRGLHRLDAELVILDEAFRGIDRVKRDLLLTRARDYWAEATLICVTHDVSHTLSFDRVLVLDQGRIVEDDDPQVLVAQPDSRFKALLDEEEMVRIKLWESAQWRHLHLAEGVLTETVEA